MLFFFPLNLIQVQGYSATQAGAALLPFILLMFLLSRWSGGLLDRYGAKAPAGDRPTDRSRRIRAIRQAGHRRLLLDHVLSGGPGAWDSAWRSASRPLTTTVMNAVEQTVRRSRVRDQQCRVARRRPAGGGGLRSTAERCFPERTGSAPGESYLCRPMCARESRRSVQARRRRNQRPARTPRNRRSPSSPAIARCCGRRWAWQSQVR